MTESRFKITYWDSVARVIAILALTRPLLAIDTKVIGQGHIKYRDIGLNALHPFDRGDANI